MNCPNCGREFIEGTTPDFCPTCGAKVEGAEEYYSQGEFEDAPVSESYCPFEDPGMGFFGGIYETAKQVLFSPTEFFRLMPPSGGLGRPVIYAVIMGVIGAFFSAGYSLLINLGVTWAGAGATSSSGMGAFGNPLVEVFGVFGGFLFSVVLSPFYVLAGVFIGGLIYHGVLALVGGANNGLECTIRVVCYGQTVGLIYVVPICGLFVAGIWMIVLMIIGLSQAQDTTAGKAAIAVLSPILLIGCCVGIMIALFAGVLGASMSSSGF